MQTRAGQTAPSSTSRIEGSAQGARQQAGSTLGQGHRDAINAAFVQLEGAFPLKYRRAFPTPEAEAASKRVWLQSLKEFAPRRILRAVQAAIETTRFFPDLADIRKLCKPRFEELGLPEPLQAYYEACRASNRTAEGYWSHIAVYLAARETGWSLLESEPQHTVLPVFERNYQIITNRLIAGEDLHATIHKALDNPARVDLLKRTEAAAERRLRSDMQDHGINPDGGRDEFLRALDDL